MKDLLYETYYTASDLYEAFDMGLDTALFILERVVGLSSEDQLYILNEIRMNIRKDCPYSSKR